MKTCLVVVFNSPYPSNVPILLQLYADRFDHVCFLTHEPADHPNAIQIEGESYYFHNFFLQAFDKIRGYDYYIITHDDAVLHPQLNQTNLWSRFSIPDNSICLRNIDIVPRNSKWFWADPFGYSVVDRCSSLRTFLTDHFSFLCSRFSEQAAPFRLSHLPDPLYQMRHHGPPLLFGGGPNADLLLLPRAAFEQLVAKIELLNYPGLFVEIVVPTAALLTDFPLYLLQRNRHAPTHRQSRWFHILVRLSYMLLSDRLSHHPIKLAKVDPSSLRLFVKLYRAFVPTTRLP